MPSRRTMLEQVLAAYRDQDWDECIARVRPLVEAAPLAEGPRQLLAALYLRTGNSRLASAQYRKLLALALGRGQLFHALACQRRIDRFESAAADPGRWVALQARLRVHGLPYLNVVPVGSPRPWTEAQLLALPRSWFERVATETTVVHLGLTPGVVDAPADTLWEVFAGRIRWSFALADGRASAEALAAEGETIRVDPEVATHAAVSFVPELPAECLRFDPPLVTELRAALHALRPAGAAALTLEARALLPSRPRQRDDPDVARPAVPSAPTAPPRLASEGLRAVSGTPDGDAPWLEHGMLSLAPGERTGGGAAPGPSTGPDGPREHTIELPPGDLPPVRRRGRPLVERPGPIEMGEGLIIPPSPDPFAAPIPNLGQPVERRRGSRVAASYASRIAILRLAGARVPPAEGRLFDLSPTGLGVHFARTDVAARPRTLENAVVAIELDLPDGDAPLRVAGQVRWLERDDETGDLRIGIEFVLLTEPDRRRIAGTLARVTHAA